MHIKRTIRIERSGTDIAAMQLDDRIKRSLFKNFAQFTDCVSEINNTQIDNEKFLDVVMLMYKLIEHSDMYLERCGCLWPYYRDEPNTTLGDSESFRTKI